MRLSWEECIKEAEMQARMMRLRPGDFEDFSTDAAVKVFLRQDPNGEDSRRAYLHRAIRNCLVDQIRDQRRRPQVGISEIATKGCQADALLADMETRRIIGEILALEPILETLMLPRGFQGKHLMEEAGPVTIGGMKSRLNRAKINARNEMRKRMNTL